MNIVLEGCDCVGKTSIADLFVRQGYERVKMSAPQSKWHAISQLAQLAERLEREDNLVVDRAWLGECVYGQIMRGYDTSALIHEYENHLPKNTLLVLVYATPETVMERFDGEFITEKQIPEVLEWFSTAYEHSNAPNKFAVDTTIIKPTAAWQLISRYVEEQEE